MAILKEVPPLKESQVENFDDLMNKVTHWLGTKLGPTSPIIKGLIMVRRYSWIGKGCKSSTGDCIVMNFSQPFFSRDGVNSVGGVSGREESH